MLLVVRRWFSLRSEQRGFAGQRPAAPGLAAAHVRRGHQDAGGLQVLGDGQDQHLHRQPGRQLQLDSCQEWRAAATAAATARGSRAAAAGLRGRRQRVAHTTVYCALARQFNLTILPCYTQQARQAAYILLPHYQIFAQYSGKWNQPGVIFKPFGVCRCF